MSFTPTSAGASTVSSLGSMVSGIGGIISAQNATAMGSYNANISLQQAQAQTNSFALTKMQQTITASQQIAQQQAAYDKSGVAFKGTPVEVQIQGLTNLNLDMAINSYNNDIQVQNLQNQAALDRYTAAQTASADYVKAGTSLLGGGLDLASEIGSGINNNSYTFSAQPDNYDPYANVVYGK